MRIAVVGANVAGSYLAYLLARNRMAVELFDRRAPWAKPCGGGVTLKGVGEFGLLARWEGRMEAVRGFRLIAPGGHATAFTARRPLYLWPRLLLCRNLLEAATGAGAVLVREHVRQVRRQTDGRWAVATHEGEHRGYDYLVGADGTASTVRRCLDRPFARDDLILALDYHFDDPRCPPQVALQFLGDGMGYLWLFASREYASAGIGVPATGARVTDLATRVEAFLQTVAPSLDPGTSRKTRWVIPYCRRGFEERYRLQGDGWALIGDAAGLADPMSGEGIYYALKSARLLAEGFLFDRPEDYGGAVERVLRAELAKADGIASDYFRPRILNPLVRVAGWSPSLADFLAGYLTGAASYQTARRDLGRRMGTILGEVVRAPFGGGSGKQFP